MYDCFVFHARTQEEADAFRELSMIYVQLKLQSVTQVVHWLTFLTEREKHCFPVQPWSLQNVSFPGAKKNSLVFNRTTEHFSFEPALFERFLHLFNPLKTLLIL